MVLNLDTVNDGENSAPIGRRETAYNERRGAIRRRIHQINGHDFLATFLTRRHYCTHCKYFLSGPEKQSFGYQCQLCSATVHQRCTGNVTTECRGTRTRSVPQNLDLIQVDQTYNSNTSDSGSTVQNHLFTPQQFYKPTFCKYCTGLIYGLVKQGLQCKGCSETVHKRCHENVSNPCKMKS